MHAMCSSKLYTLLSPQPTPHASASFLVCRFACPVPPPFQFHCASRVRLKKARPHSLKYRVFIICSVYRVGYTIGSVPKRRYITNNMSTRSLRAAAVAVVSECLLFSTCSLTGVCGLKRCVAVPSACPEYAHVWRPLAFACATNVCVCVCPHICVCVFGVY